MVGWPERGNLYDELCTGRDERRNGRRDMDLDSDRLVGVALLVVLINKVSKK